MTVNKLTLAVQTIKDSVSALDVGQAMGLEIRHGRCKCPIHNGGDFNCVLYKGNRGFYCHTCKAGGDVVTLVQQYYNMQFKETVAWFNTTFHLGMDIDSPMNPEAVRIAEKQQEMRRQMRENAEWLERFRFDMALLADMIVRALEKQRDENVPKTPYETWNKDFCDAVILLPKARRLADDCMMYCMKTNDP